MTELQTMMTGISFGESPRWHDGRLWFADWGAEELIAVDLDGAAEVIAPVHSFPFCIDWLPDGTLLVVSARDRSVLRMDGDRSLETYVDLRPLSDKGWNEIVVDGRGNAYVNGGGFDLMAGEPFAPGIIVLVTPDGSALEVADGIAFPNGMAVMPDNRTLIVAESYAARLTAFEIGADGSWMVAACGPISATPRPTGSASTRPERSGTRTSPTGAACGSPRAAPCSTRSSSTAAAFRARSGETTAGPCSWSRANGKVARASRISNALVSS